MKTEITSKIKAALELSNAIGFTGKYVESLISSAQKVGLTGKTVEQLLKSHKARTKATQTGFAKSFGLSLKSYLELKTKAIKILRDLNAGYSMGEVRKLILKGKDGVFATFDNTQEYARSSKWRANHGLVELKISLADLRGMQKIAGVWTRGMGGKKVRYIDTHGAKNKFATQIVDGFLFGESHARTSKEARNLDRRNRIQKTRTERAQLLDAQKREIEERAAVTAEKVFIGWDDIRKIACEPASEKFVRDNHLDKNFGYNVGFLETLADKGQRNFIKRAGIVKARTLLMQV